MTKSEIIHTVVFFLLMVAIVLQWIGFAITDHELAIASSIWLIVMTIEGIYMTAKELNS